MSAVDQTHVVVAWGTTALSPIVFLPFGWAVRGHFVKQGRLPTGMTLLTLASLLVYGCMFVVMAGRNEPPPIARSLAALVLMTLAAVLFWWAIVTTRKGRLNLAHSGVPPDHVQSSGPYAWIRHPFYTAYVLFWIGTATLAGGWQWLPVCGLIVWYILVARAEEKLFSESVLATSYIVYRDRTGMMVPQFRSFFRCDRC